MSGTDDCASQDIEASTSSNSTRNSMKYTFLQSILNTENSQIACSSGPNVILGRERVPELPILEKNDFIQNWIFAHCSLADSPEKSSSGSPILGISSAKRSPQSPILGYQWKRIKREEGSKENCRVSLNKKFQQIRFNNPLVTAKITIGNEISSNNEVDKTLKSANSPVLNRITNSPSSNTSRRSCRFGVTKSPSKFDGDSTLKWNDGKSLVRENTEIPETLSLSSPLCKRNNPFKIVDSSNNYPKQTIEAFNKQLLKYSEILVEESPYDVEVISLSSKIPETLSHSTVGDAYGELKVDSKKRDLPKYDLQANEDTNKLDRLHCSPSSSSSIKIEAETSSDNDQRSKDHESPNSSVRLSIPSPFRRKKKLIASKSYRASWIRAKTSPVKLETVETLKGFDHLKNVQESSSIPDTLSVSSQLRESLVPESSNSCYRLSTHSPLRKKKVIVSSPLVHSLIPEISDPSDRLSVTSQLRRKKLTDTEYNKTSWMREKNGSVKSEATEILHGSKHSQKYSPDRLSNHSLLRQHKFIGINSNNTSSITARNSFITSEGVDTLQEFELSKKVCKSLEIPDTLSSQLHKSLVPESSDSPDRVSNHSLLRQHKFIGINSNNTSSITARNSFITSEGIDTLQEFEPSKKIRKSLEIPETLLASAETNEIIVSESSNSPNLLSPSASLAKNMHVGITCVNPPMMRIKDCPKRLIEIGESSKLSKTLSERIDFETSITNAPEDDIKIESDSDCTISDFIANPVNQNREAIGNFSKTAKSNKLVERHQDLDDRISTSPQDNKSCDSDETYYSDGDSIPGLRITEASPLKNSQQVSQSTSQSHESRIISQASSPLKNNNCEPPSNVMLLYTTNINNKKKKKAKKGSLVAKLQTLVNSQVSKFRIWRYQMSQPDFKNAHTQFVKMKIRGRETRYGRHYLTASVIEDSHDLLESIFKSESNLSNEKGGASLEMCIVTLVIVPEIIGVVKIPAQSTLKIYPPWEIMDQHRKILNVMFFTVGAPEKTNVNNEVVIERGYKNVLQEFECPCIRAKALVDSCRVKFTNTKTSVVQTMFTS